MAYLTNKKLISLLICVVVLLAVSFYRSPSDIDQQSVEIESSPPDTLITPPLVKTVIAEKPKPIPPEPQAELKPDATQCEHRWIDQEDVALWKQQKKSAIKVLLADFRDQGVESRVLDKVYIESGIGLLKGRRLFVHFRQQVRRPAFYEVKGEGRGKGEGKRATMDQQRALRLLRDTGDFAGLIQQVADKAFADELFYLGKQGQVTLLSYILEAEPTQPPEVIEDLIERLIDSGISVNYSDLAVVTQLPQLHRLGVPLATMNRLYLSSGLSADKVLSLYAKQTSLALLAISAQNVALANYWIDMGSPLRPDLYYDNGLDKLAKHGAKFSQTDIDSLFEQIALRGFAPAWSKSVGKLKAMVSPPLFNRYAAQMGQKNHSLSGEEDSIAHSIVKLIHHHILTGMVDFPLDAEPQHHCFDQLGQRLTRFAMKRHRGKRKTKADRVALAAAEAVEAAAVKDLIAQAKEQFSSDEDIEDYLAQAQGLRNKEAIAQFRLSQIRKLSEAMKLQISQPTPEERQTMMAAIKLAYDGKWSEAIEAFEQLGGYGHTDEAMTLLLMIALNARSDFDVIVDLLSRGAKFMPNAVDTLVKHDDAALAKQLLPYGLDIHYVEMGESMLARSVQLRSFKILKFLLANGVAPDSDAMGYDALDWALKRFNLNREGLTIVSLLMDAGARIELSHQQIVAKLQAHNMPAYSALIGAYSGLKL